MKMTGPYTWVPPAYWYADKEGGAFGFNSETSAGASIPPLEDLARMLSPQELEALWKYPQVRQYHAAAAWSLLATDASFDTAVSTLVLCTVDEPERALRDIARVLRPGGQLLFIEHVRADSALLAACQDRLLDSWRRFAGGCRCNRPTVDLMRACGFDVTADDAVWRGMPAIVRPLVVGRATKRRTQA